MSRSKTCRSRRRTLPVDDFHRDPKNAAGRQYARDQDAGRIPAPGRLDRQPCRACGDPDSHAHRPDYSKPLAVQWLCPADHREVHRATA